MAQAVYPKAVVDSFWGKVDKSGGPDACWLWTATLAGPGYGNAWDGNRKIGAHRLAWIVTNGAIADGLWVLHHCDVMRCCNPSHLFLGTCADNVRDREAKGRGFLKRGMELSRQWRSLRGTARANAKLTEETVAEIVVRYRAGGITQSALASAYGVHPSIISEIVNGKRWPHVTRAL